jgi:predicted alpha/beta-fold hydrolase
VLITQYLCGLGENGVEPGVIGALCVSSTFDGVVTSKQMEQPMSLLTFNHYLTENLVQLLKRHRDIFKKADDLPFDIDSVLQVSRNELFKHNLFHSTSPCYYCCNR